MNFCVNQHDYENTGGGCMVSVFTVTDFDKIRTLFVYVGDESLSVNTVDFLRLPIDPDKEMTLKMIDFCVVANGYYPPSTFDRLIKHCVMLHAQRTFETCGALTELPLQLLSNQLLSTISNEYREWHDYHLLSYFTTDGNDIIPPDSYHDYRRKNIPRDVVEAARSLLVLIEQYEIY